MDERLTAEVIARALGIATGIGVALSPFVFAAVTILRGMMTGSKRLRRVVLPLSGLLIGWTLTGLALALVGAEMTLPSVALVLLAGFWAYAVSSQLNAQSKESKRG